MSGVSTWKDPESMQKWAEFSANEKGIFEYQNPHLRNLLGPVIERLRLDSGTRAIRILDLGCGDGRVLKLLPKSSGPYEYTGVDLSDLLQIARQNPNTGDGSIYTFHDDNAVDYVSTQGGNQSFDLILLIHFLHYTDKGKVPEFTRSLYSLLSKNGFLFYYMNDSYYYEIPLVKTIDTLPFIKCKSYLQWVIAKKMGE